MKITMDLDEQLYRAVKVEAARSNRSVRDLVAEAIDRYLALREDEEDVRSAEAALDEYKRDGGAAAADFYRDLAAEAEATYGSAARSEK